MQKLRKMMPAKLYVKAYSLIKKVLEYFCKT